MVCYVNGGYTETRFDQIYLPFAFAPPVASPFVVPAQTYRGWFIGGGTEFALTIIPIPGFFWRNEYRYSSYQSADIPILPLSFGTGFHVRTQVQTIATEIVYKLNFAP